MIQTENTYALFVDGEDIAGRLAGRLVVKCVQFHVEPWPDDRWCFTVKDEARQVLEFETKKEEVSA